jgi:hypothetical protein
VERFYEIDATPEQEKHLRELYPHLSRLDQDMLVMPWRKKTAANDPGYLSTRDEFLIKAAALKAKEIVGSTVHALLARIELLHKRIDELECEREQFGYVGSWAEGTVYRKGNFCSHSGSLWHCRVEATQEKPSTHCADWQLAVKRGRDGKDAKT